jgi:hypothetical protein
MTKPPREIYVVKPEDGQVGLWASETRILEGMIEYVEKSAYTALEAKLEKVVAALETVMWDNRGTNFDLAKQILKEIGG